MRKNMPNTINKLEWRRVLRVEKQKIPFTIIIKQGKKVVYRNKGYAGVVNIVQSVDDFDVKELSFSGDTQAFGFGHPCIQLFALDQLRKKLRFVITYALKILQRLTKHPELTKHSKLKEFMLSIGKENSIR